MPRASASFGSRDGAGLYSVRADDETMWVAGAMAPVMSIRDWGLLWLLAFLWGGSYFFTEIALTALPPLTIVTIRVGLAAITLWALVRMRGLSPPGGWRPWAVFAGMAILNNVIPFSLIVWGQTRIDSSLASILNGATPLWTVLLAHVWASERLTINRVAGVVIGMAGVAWMLGAGALTGSLTDGALWGEIAVLGATLSYACSAIYARRYLTGPPLVTAAGQVTMATLLMIPAMLLIDQPWTLPKPGMDVVLALIGFGVLSTGFAYWLYFTLMARAGATNVMLVTLLNPVSAILLGTLILGERLEAQHLTGMALIAFGLIVLDGRALRLLRRGHGPERV